MASATSMSTLADAVDARAGAWPFDPGAPLAKRWPGSVVDALCRHALRTPDMLCCTGPDRQLRYDEALAAASRLAEDIAPRSSREAGVVSIVAERGPRLTIALFAAMIAQRPFHIIDPSYPLDRIQRLLDYASASGILNACDRAEPARRLAATLDGGRGGFCIDVGFDERAPAAADNRRASSPSAIDGDTPMYVTFTSGTTGLPKAVWGGHGPVSHFLDWQTRRFAIGPDDRVSVLSGLAHDPVLRDVLMPVWAGCTMCFPPDDVYRYPGALFEWMRQARITIAHLTPSLARVLLNRTRTQRDDALPALRCMFVGGEPLSHALATRIAALAPAAQLVNCYGATETPQVMGFHVLARGLANTMRDADSSPLVPIGEGIDGVQLLVVDEACRLCPPGIAGELFVRTPYRALRVENLSGAPACSYVRNPYSSDAQDLLYRTGDYGAYRDDGLVLYRGRRDRQVKVRGYRIDLSEIEHAVLRCGGFTHHHVDAVIEDGDCRLALFAVPDASHPRLSGEELREALSALLPSYMIPERIVTLPSLPCTPNGKVDAARLRAMLTEASLTYTPKAKVDAPPLHTTHTDAVASTVGRLREAKPPPAAAPPEIVARLHAMRPPLVHEGERIVPMDSLQLVEFCCALEDEFGVRLSIDAVRACTTVPLLARCIARSARPSQPTSNSVDTPFVAVDACDGEVNVPAGAGHSPSVSDASSGRRPRTMRPVGVPDLPSRPAALRWLPRNESVGRAFANRLLQIVARVAPDALRTRLHRWRGVSIGANASIGYDTIIETAFPSLVRIGNGTNIGMRVTIIAHFRGMERGAADGPTVVIEDHAFIGPGAIILPNVTIGEGAVVAAGSVVTASVPPRTFAQGNPARIAAVCGLPLTGDTSYDDFLAHLVPLAAARHDGDPASHDAVNDRR